MKIFLVKEKLKMKKIIIIIILEILFIMGFMKKRIINNLQSFIIMIILK